MSRFSIKNSKEKLGMKDKDSVCLRAHSPQKIQIEVNAPINLNYFKIIRPSNGEIKFDVSEAVKFQTYKSQEIVLNCQKKIENFKKISKERVVRKKKSKNVKQLNTFEQSLMKAKMSIELFQANFE
jgi:hypothetical protein